MQLTILAKSAEMPGLNSLKGFLQSEGVGVAQTQALPIPKTLEGQRSALRL